MAISGHNGNNETKIGLSSSLTLNYFDAEDGSQLRIQSSSKPIDMWISRDFINNTTNSLDYSYVNVSNLTLNNGPYYLINVVAINATNASFHIQLKPTNSEVAYLILTKFGALPVLNQVSTFFNNLKYFFLLLN